MVGSLRAEALSVVFMCLSSALHSAQHTTDPQKLVDKEWMWYKPDYAVLTWPREFSRGSNPDGWRDLKYIT